MALNGLTITNTVPAGDTYTHNAPGAQVICYESTGELEISLEDGRGWAPFMRGIEINEPHQKLVLRNTTGADITFTAVQTSKAGAFVDRRELAAQIAVDGGIVTNTAPLTDQGGSIQKVGSSNFSSSITGGSGGSTTQIVNGAGNTYGCTVRQLYMDLYTEHSAKALNYFVTSNPTMNPYGMRSIGTWASFDSLYLPVGCGLSVFMAQGAQAHIFVNYQFW